MLRIATNWPSAGLLAGPLAWAINTQASYMLPEIACGAFFNPIPWLALGMALLAAGGALLSWGAWVPAIGVQSVEDTQGGRPHQLLAGIGVLSGALFALVILMQGAAAFVLSGCER